MPALSVTTSANEWRATTLGESCIMYQPKTITRKEMNADGKFPVYGANGVIGRHNEYNHDDPELVIGCRGSIGMAHITEPKSWINGNAMVIQSKNGDISQSFLRYLFLGGIDISSAISGTAQPQITRKSLSPVEFSYPIDSKEQERIVRILDQTFNNINDNISQMEIKLQNAKNLFRSQLTKYFNSPEPDWISTTMGEQFVLQRGFDITKKQQNEGPFPVVSSGGIRSYHDTAKVQAPGVVVGRKGSIGSVYYLEVDFWPHDTTLWIKDFCGNNPKLVYYYLQSLDLKQYDSGSANPALNRNNLHPLRINWPPVNKQESTTNLLDSLFLETVELERVYHTSLNILSELKQSILKEAFNGTLRIA